ncbi:MAG: hypothetical protein ACK56I_04070, partial [bacterium]
MHLTKLVGGPHDVARAAAGGDPTIDHAFVRVPAVVGGDQRDIDAHFTGKPHEGAEVRVPHLAVEAAPVVLDAHCDHGTLRAASIARRLKVDELCRQRAPEGGHGGKELGGRLPRATSDPPGQPAAD